MARRTIKRIRLWDLGAGDKIVIKQGTIQKKFRVCEVQDYGDRIHFVYKDHGLFVRNNGDPNDIVRVIR